MSAPHDESVDTHRRGLRIEIGVMLAVTFGVSALVAVLQLADAVLSGLGGHRVRLNPNQSRYDLINLGLNLVRSHTGGLGRLALYLLWRSGIRPAGDRAGPAALASRRAGGWAWRRYRHPGAAALRWRAHFGLNAEVEPSGPAQLVVADPGTDRRGVRQRLRRGGRGGGLPDHPVTAVRPEPGPGGARLQRVARALSPVSGDRRRAGQPGDGVVFGYAWCRTGRLWPLVIAHGVIDTVAFVGYVLLAGQSAGSSEPTTGA